MRPRLGDPERLAGQRYRQVARLDEAILRRFIAGTGNGGSGGMRMFPPGRQPCSRARPYPCRAPSSWGIRWLCRIKGVFIQAPDLADMLKALARNLDGTPPRYKCTEVVNAQVSGLEGGEGGRSVNRRLSLRWFEPNTCHHLRKRPVAWAYPGSRAFFLLSRCVS